MNEIRGRFALVLAGLSFATALAAQEPPASPEPGVEELTRGPVHEAFGEPVMLNAQPGPIVPQAPPAAIEEMPPEQKPEGEHVAWIPGYWQWDDEARHFIWVSGLWRSIPPNHTWIPGSWHKVSDGYQWVSGFWNVGTTEVEYHPEPPASLEAGPNSAAPSDDYIWISGCWIWRENRYLWRPGFWMAGNPNWTWVPSHYCWTPGGHVFIDGYWDYPIYRRGMLFAPAVFNAGIRVGYVYRPRIVLDLEILTTSLFVRPRYGHYYFGDYYAANYMNSGYYPWFSFHGSRFGYDPLFAHLEWSNYRHDPNWERNLKAIYLERREKPAFRPPHTFSAYQEWSHRPEIVARKNVDMARTLTDVTKIKNYPTKLERVDERRLADFKQHSQQVAKVRDDRMKLEQKVFQDQRKFAAEHPTEVVRHGPPVRMKIPGSPVFGPAGRASAIGAPEHPIRPTPIQHDLNTIKPAAILPHPEEILRPEFNRGRYKRP